MADRALRAPASRWPALAGFSLGFRLAEGLLFLPVAGIVGAWLAGGAVVDAKALLPLLLSPRGALLVLLGGTLFFLLRWFEHAGLSAIAFAAADGQRLSAADAARLVLARLPLLARLALAVTLRVLLALAPFLLVLGAAGFWLLSRHDINFYLDTRPPEALRVAAGLAVGALVSLALLARLVGRVRLAVQVALFERLGPAATLARSARLTEGHRLRVVLLAGAFALLTLLLGAGAALAGSALARPLLDGLAGSGRSLLLAFGLLVLVRSGLGLAATWIASLLDALAFTHVYRRRRAALGEPVAPGQPPAAPHRLHPLLLAAAALAAAGVAASGVRVAFDALGKPEDIRIYAHRGLSGDAAENTLLAFEAAFRAGADAVETDVQLTRDGVLVLVHDADFARVAGVPRRVAAMTLAEVQAIRLPGSDPRVATLRDLLRLARGRGQILLEPKTYRDTPPDLVPKLVALVQAEGAADRVMIQSFRLADLRAAERLAPDIPVGYLVAAPAGPLRGLRVDFLSVERMRVRPRLLAEARRSGTRLLVWNVRSREQMRRLADLGVDGVIVDDVRSAVAVREEAASEEPLARAVRQMVLLLGG